MKPIQYHQDYPKEKIYSTAMDLDLIKRLWGYLRPYRFWIFVSFTFLLVSKIIEATVPIVIGKVAQQILLTANEDSAAKENLLSVVIKVCVLMMGFLLFSYLSDVLNVIIKSFIGQKALLKLRLDVYTHIQHMPLSYYDKHSIGRLMTRTIHDIDQVNQMLTESVVPLIGNLFLFLAIIIGILFIDWRFAFVVVFLLPIVFLLTYSFSTHQRRCYERVRSIVSAMNTFVQEHLMGAFTIRNFGLEKKERGEFEKINEDHCNAYLETIKNFAFFISSIDFLQSSFLIIGFIFIAFSMSPGSEFNAGTFFTLSLYALMFFRPLADLAERYNVLQSAMAASERIFNLMDQPAEDSSEKLTLEDVETIEFRDIWFAYEKENWILRGFSFCIKKGESIALVGITGEGKTTVASLLLQFYIPQKGAILINGRNINEYSKMDLRRHFSLVLQDPVIFSGTIFDNISLYQTEITKEAAQKVMDTLGVHGFPLDTSLSERGKTLSLGEMQLISLVRAVANNRSVFILDEATANIDTNTEKMIQSILKKVLKDKTAVVIAHRLSTIKDVNRVLVLHKGKIVEEGSHSQLIQANGIYEKLYRLQFQHTSA